MQLIPPSLACLKALVAGNLHAAGREIGLAFEHAPWPNDAEMREGLAVHLSVCEHSPRDLLWRVFMIADDNNAVVGHSGFKGGPGRGGELEIYWCVEPRWRGKGIAKSSAASLCAHAFANSAVASITATIAQHNVQSQQVARALGMAPVERALKHGLPLWRIDRDGWRPVATPLLVRIAAGNGAAAAGQ